MAIQLSTSARNAALDALETAIGTAPTLKIWSGTIPASAAAADGAGAVLATMALPSDWLAPASGGSKGLSGTWQDLAADSTGTAAHYRIYQGATCHWQGSVTATGGGGDMTLDNVSIASGQTITVTSFNITASGA